MGRMLKAAVGLTPKAYGRWKRRVKVWIASGQRCHLCLNPLPFPVMTLDHYIPLCAGGPSTLENLKAACGPCNQGKSGKIPTE